MKTIKEILNYFNLESNDEREIDKIAMHTYHIEKNTMFIALNKGNNYLKEAKRKKAIYILSDKDIPYLEKKINEFILWFYDYPSLDIELIGITGTNGKTTTAYFLHQLLRKSLLISNVEYGKNIYLCRNTTPTFIEICYALNLAKKRKLKYLIMEVSSIGIIEKRVEGLAFSYLLLTNLTSDHLDYHKSLENYQNAKITFLNNQVGKLIIGELDRYLENKIQRKFIKMQFRGKKFHLSIINQKNYCLAFTTYLEIINKKRSLKSLLRLKLPKGRSQIMIKRPKVVIDYAHTEMAFLEILKEEKRVVKGRLLVLFGAGGNRDKEKREKYGRLVEQYADLAIVTNDNPRDELPIDIVNDIISFDPNFFHIELDRKKAIYQILSLANKNDTVLILGRGHELLQTINGKDIYLSDEEEVKKWIKEH